MLNPERQLLKISSSARGQSEQSVDSRGPQDLRFATRALDPTCRGGAFLNPSPHSRRGEG
eukprot:9670296-Alexandrium_andersonii.AAC.1